MIKIRIGTAERHFEDATPSWIRDQIESRREDGIDVGVVVTIEHGSLNMVLTTPGASSGGGSGREPKPQELEIFDLWEKRGMKDKNFNVGQLIAFLNEIKSKV